MRERFRWRSEGHDDADAEDDRLKAADDRLIAARDRLIAAQGNGLADTTNPFRVQPLGELLPALRNAVSQADQRADSQRRRAARAEARLAQLRGDLAWIVLAVFIGAFGCGFLLAWAIVRRGGIP